MKIIVILYIIAWVFIILMSIRNEKVYKFYNKVLDNYGYEVFKKLPSYYTMVFKFWKPLNLEKLIK